MNDKTLFVFLKIINSFHIGRGGLSLSFMGNSITKSSTLCLLEIINSLFTVQNQSYKYVRVLNI
jgi:hypothetical protein